MESAIFQYQSKCVHLGHILAMSEENKIVVVKDNGMQIVEIEMRPDVSGGRCSVHNTLIGQAEEAFVSEVGISHKQLHQMLREGDLDLVQLTNDRTLSPKMSSYLSHKIHIQAAWSPMGLGTQGRCVLASLSMDHRICVHAQLTKKQRWSQVCDVSVLYHEHMKPSLLHSCPTDKALFTTYKARVQQLACTAITWSSTICKDVHQDVSPDGSPPHKRSRAPTIDPSYCYLCAAMMSGDVVLFKVSAPCDSSTGVEVSEVVSTDLAYPTVVKWCSTQTTDFLTIGCEDGRIAALVRPAQPGSCGSASQPGPAPILLWQDTDNATVSSIDWCPQSCVLTAVKGNFLFAFKLDVTSTAINVLHSEHIMVSQAYPPIRMLYSHGQGYITNTEQTIKTFTTKTTEKGIEICLGDVELPVTKGGKRWGIIDACVSRSAGLITYIESILGPKCHLAASAAVKFYMEPGMTEDQCIDHFLTQQQGEFWHDRDKLECLRLHLYRTGWQVLPSKLRLYSLSDVDWAHWHTQTPYLLKLVRYCLKCLQSYRRWKHAKDLEMIPTKQELENHIEMVEYALLLHHIHKYKHKLNQVTGELSHLGVLIKARLECCEQTILSLMEMKSQDTSSNVTHAQLEPETCPICSSNIPFTNPKKAVCANEHPFQRCCVTLACCIDLTLRTCRNCGAHSIQHTHGEIGVIGHLLQERCTFCDGLLLSNT